MASFAPTALTPEGTVNEPPASRDQLPAVGEMAHDLNNQLGIIIANLDLLDEQPELAPWSDLVHETMDAALRSADLLRQLKAVTDRATPAPQPIVSPAPTPATGDTRNAGADPRGSETVLVVDDNLGMRQAVARQLGELGYRVIEAEDGPTALMILNSESVDLLFTDVVMPGGLSGYDLARLVLSRWPAMRALITTGFPELEPGGNSASQAHLRRLQKPYRKAELAQTLREVLDA